MTDETGIFKLHYEVTGDERKELVKAISRIMQAAAHYEGAPTFNYTVDYIMVDPDGTVSFDARADSEEIENLIDGLAEAGFKADGSTTETETVKIEPHADESDDTSLSITLPKGEDFTVTAEMNLKRLLEAKGELIKKALGAARLDFETDDENITFAWWDEMPDNWDITAFSTFQTALLKMAKSLNRINAQNHQQQNEKYAFRCFLLRLGFIGDEYKAVRKVLLKNLSGSSAFKSGERRETISDAVSE